MSEATYHKAKLLLLVTQSDFGGAQRYVFDMALGLRDAWDVTVATGRPNGSRELLNRAAAIDVPTKIFHHLRRAINPWHDVAAIFEIANYLRREQVDVVLANSSKAEVIAAVARLFAPRPKQVATIHGFAFLEPVGLLRKLLYFKFQWLAGRLRDATIVLSEYERRVALRYHITRPQTIHVIPHGIGAIDFLDRDTARARLGLPKEKTVVGTIANLYATKGLDLLVSPPLSAIAKSGENVFVILGEGPERARLQRLIQERGLESRVHLVGAVENAAQYLKAFDLFVLPSRKEGMPYTLLEAAAAALPIVATTVGAVPEIFENNKHALLVPPDDPRALARALHELLANPLRSRQLGECAKARVGSIFSLDEEIKKTATVLTSFLGHD